MKKDEKTEMIAIALPILPGKIEVWKTKILDKMLGENKPDTDAIRHAAVVRERSFLQETPDGHMVILTFEGKDPITGYSQIIQKMPSEFAELVMEVHGLDVNAPQPTVTKHHHRYYRLRSKHFVKIGHVRSAATAYLRSTLGILRHQTVTIQLKLAYILVLQT